MKKVHTLILGAGLSGLATGYYLKEAGIDFLIIEKNSYPGGLCITEKKGEYFFDITGHWLHLRYEHTRKLVNHLLNGEYLVVLRKSKIFSHNTFTDYPFQANLFGLPSEVVKECLLEFIKSYVKRGCGEKFSGKSFKDFINFYFGKGIAKHFLEPYNTKIYGVSTEEITAEWCGRFVPIPDLEDVIDGTLGTRKLNLGYNATFIYPKQGGIFEIAKRLASRVSNILYDSEAVEVDLDSKKVRLKSGEIVEYENLVSTIPLVYFVKMVTNVPDDVLKYGEKLRYTTLRYLNVGVKRKVLRDYHWVYFPEEKYPFYRIGCFSNAASYFAPEGHSSLYVEISNNRKDVKLSEVLESLVEFFNGIGEISSGDDIEFVELRKIPVAYVIFDHNYYKSLEIIKNFFNKYGVYSIGRYGRWVYSSMEDALNDGYETAQKLKEEYE